MKCVVGIDLGSTTTKAVMLDEQGQIVGKGITNSRSNYAVASAIARDEALTNTRFSLLDRALGGYSGAVAVEARALENDLLSAFRLELYLDELAYLDERVQALLQIWSPGPLRDSVTAATTELLADMQRTAPDLFLGGVERKSDFFRDVAGQAFVQGAERVCGKSDVPFERLVGLFDRAILDVETRVQARDFGVLLPTAVARVAEARKVSAEVRAVLDQAARDAAAEPVEEVALAGTGYGRQTLPFPKEAVRSEILCHGRGAHRVFPGTRSVLDIGGQDTKAIQVDENGVVTSFQMNDRCAAGCGRYLGYIADELNLGLHELGPLALKATRMIRVNSTCTVFAGAELRERLALGQQREDILAGLHRAILLRAMSLLARSGGIENEFTFTGGVCKNPMATKLLKELVVENYGEHIQLNIHPDSIYMGALGAAMFALDDFNAGHPSLMPAVATAARSRPAPMFDASCA
jgi:benzoyl-CoA reductase subunit A